MTQRLNILFFTLLISIDIKADFFAFRRLMHPQTKKVIYLLYDAHASLVIDPNLANITNTEIDKIARNAPMNVKELKPLEENEEINSKLDSYRRNMPNLLKQQQDLLDLTNKYLISLIDEDWPWPSDLVSIAFKKVSNKYIGRYFGSSRQYKDKFYALQVTPLLDIGKKLTGKFTKKEFIPLATGAYFYNPDDRWSIGIGGNSVECKAMDATTLKAIDSLFTKYNQHAIIIAEGLEHISEIAQALVDRGYSPGPMIISQDLAKRRTESPDLNQYLNIIETNKKLPTFYDDSIDYALIANPLDIQKLLESEFKKDGIKKAQAYTEKKEQSEKIREEIKPNTGKQVLIDRLTELQQVAAENKLKRIAAQIQNVINLFIFQPYTKDILQLASEMLSDINPQATINYLGQPTQLAVLLDPVKKKLDIEMEQ